MNETIKNIVNFINKNGDRFSSEFEVAGTPIKFPQVLTRDIIDSHGNLENYFTQLLGKMKADSVTITTKKPNGGTSAGKNPREKTFTIHNDEKIQFITPTSTNLAGAPQSENSLVEGYKFQLSIVKSNLQEVKEELKETKESKKKYKKQRDKYKVKLDTIGEKNKYEGLSGAADQKTFWDSLSENKDLILDGLAVLKGDKASDAEATPAIAGLPQEKLVLIEVVKALEEGAQLNFYNEIMLRMAQIQGEGNAVLLKAVRELTPQCDAHFSGE